MPRRMGDLGRGVDRAGVQLVTTTLKILPLLVIGIAGTLAFEPSHVSLADVEGGIGKGVMAGLPVYAWGAK